MTTKFNDDAVVSIEADAAAGAGTKAAEFAAPRPTTTTSAMTTDTPAVRDKPGVLGFIKSCAANVPPRLRASMPTLEQIRASPHYPVLATADPTMAASHLGSGSTFNGSGDAAQALPINGDAIEWENDDVTGRIHIHMRGLPTSHHHLFEGKRRCTWGFSQVTFKRRIK